MHRVLYFCFILLIVLSYSFFIDSMYSTSLQSVSSIPYCSVLYSAHHALHLLRIATFQSSFVPQSLFFGLDILALSSTFNASFTHPLSLIMLYISPSFPLSIHHSVSFYFI
eukprot:230357_1